MKSLIVFAAAATPQRNDTLWIVRSWNGGAKTDDK